MKVKKLTAGLLAVAITVSLIAPEAFAEISGANSVGKVTVSGLTVDTPIKSASGDTGETKEPSEDESVYTFGVLEDGTIEILGYNGSGGNVVIPAEIDGKSVTSIGSYAFSDHTELTSITIPNSVKSIDDGAFFRCYHLKSIIIPDSVTSIGNFAFCGCSDLESIEIPDGVTSIGNGTFMWCSSLESIMIPHSVTSIGTDAFNSCKSVSGITIPKNVTEIGLRAFADCASLTEIKVSDENSNYASVDGVLYNKDKTSVVCYPAGIKDSNYKIIDGVTTIERESFYDCTELTSVTVPDSVTCISGEAFKSCTNLTSITLPDSAMYIDNWAFYNCTSLKEVTIPASVTAIGDEAFGYCYDGDSSETKKVDGFKINYAKNTYGHLYAVKNGFSDEIYLVTNELDDGTLTIAKYAGNSTTYEIPAEIDGKKVTDICNGAFSDCTELTNVTIPDGVKHIGYDAFYNCTSLETVTIPASVTYIYDKAFLNCTSLAAVSLPASVISVGDKAFGYYQDDNYEIKAVDGFKINYIKNTWGHWYATRNGFSDETCLVTSELYNGTLQIDGYAGNSATYVIPDEIDGKTVTQIVNNAFNDCISLKEVTIPASVTDASWSALGYYYDRDSMETKKVDGFKINYVKNTWGHMYAVRNGFTDEACLITTELDDGTIEISKYYGTNETYIIPSEIDGKKVTEIGDQAFEYNTALAGVTIPDTVTIIGWLSFRGCKALTSIKIPDSVIKIEDFAFMECDNLKNVSIPASVTEIYDYAFGYTRDEDYNYAKVDDFTLEYVKNTAGHLYAALNDFTDESYFVTEELEDGTLSISGYYAKDETYTIPPEINGKKATQIKQYAFARNKYLKSIVISENVKEIGQHAFSGCTALTDVSIPDSVTKIDARAFVNCTSILNVCVPASVTFIGEQAFGYEYDDLGYEGKIKGFNIKCYKGTAGEQYAKDNGFDYEILDSEAQCTHSNTEIRNAISAGCTTDGYTGDTYCVYCDKLISSGKVIPATGHTEVIDKAVAATCTETGLTEGKHCSVCNAVIKAQEVVPAKGHKYVDTVVKPTYTTKGYALHKCSVCGTSYKDAYTATLTLAKVGGFKVKAKDSTSITLQWNKNSSASGYIIEAYNGKTWVQVTKIAKNSTLTYKVTKLSASKTYQYRIKAYKTEGKATAYSANSATLSVNTNPSNMSGFKAKAKSYNSVTLQWNKNTSATGYELQKWDGKKWVTLTKISKNSTTTYTVKSLKASTTYKYKIRACKTIGKTTQYSAYTATLSVNTNPSNMSGFKAKSKSYNSITLQWNKNTSATGYELQKWDGKKWVTLTKISKNSTTTYTVKSLKASTTYKYRIRAYKTIGKTTQYSAYTATLSVNTNPTNMSGFKAKSKSYNSITLQWNKNTSATGYELQKWDGKKWVTLTKINKNSTTTYTVKSLKASTTYKYRIRAYKTIGKATQYSAYTATLSVNTNPTNIGGFKAKAKSYNSITLQWNKNTSATGYELQKWDGKKWVTLTKINKNSTTTYTVKSLKASTTYKYRIRAYKTIGKTTQYSSYKELSVNTNPTNMSGFKAKSKTATSVTLQWNKNASATGYELQKWNGKKWVALTKITKNSTTTYTVKNLKANTTYKYRIRAYKTIGKATQYSGYSATLSANTIPSNVSRFRLNSKTGKMLNLGWDMSDDAAGYIVQQYKGGKWVQVAKLGKSKDRVRINNLSPSTTYKFRIRKYANIGKTTVYGNWSYKSFKTEGKDCVDEVKFTPNGERIPDELWEFVDEVWTEKYYDKPVKKYVITMFGYALEYPISIYSPYDYILRFGFSVTVVGETNNNYFITEDGHYLGTYCLIDREPYESERPF